MNRRRPDRAALEAEIDHVRSLGLDALRKRWSAIFGAPPPAGITKDIIARTICHRLQEEAFGGLDRATIDLLASLARGRRPDELNRRLKPGTVLFREHAGERHTVTVAPEGFVWQGTTYSSLSTIARAITGTAWSGPRFFGLRGRIKSHGETDSRSSATRPLSPARRRSPSRTGHKAPHRGQGQ